MMAQHLMTPRHSVDFCFIIGDLSADEGDRERKKDREPRHHYQTAIQRKRIKKGNTMDQLSKLQQLLVSQEMHPAFPKDTDTFILQLIFTDRLTDSAKLLHFPTSKCFKSNLFNFFSLSGWGDAVNFFQSSKYLPPKVNLYLFKIWCLAAHSNRSGDQTVTWILKLVAHRLWADALTCHAFILWQ